jgi:23S rRNA pseudouridine2605 synthase
MLIRLQKYLADCGIASRRKAESLILAGQIKVNGQIVQTMGFKIDPAKDKIYYRDKLLKKTAEFIYIKLNKPRGHTSTVKKISGEKNILELVKIKQKIFPVGRLDKESEGLIFLTNDGDFAYQLTHPKYQVEKEYQVKIDGKIIPADLIKMRQGIKDQGELLQIKNYKIIKPNLINLILTQGHKREIRRLLAKFNYQVLQLKRLRIANWQLDNLKTGQWQYFQPKK